MLDIRAASAYLSGMATILIVDDLAVNRTLLSDFCETLGHTSTAVDGGRAALARMVEQAPDLLLLDILMPEMDGYQVLERMGALPELRDIPVLVISAVDELESVVRCIELGALDYLVKPFNPTLLKARVSACLERKVLLDSERALHRELGEKHEKLVEAEFARDSLFHMIVHDMRSPLSGILGFCQLAHLAMDKEAVDLDSLRSSLAEIRSASADLNEMTTDILDVSKLESGGIELDREPVEVVGLIQELCQRHAPEARMREVTLTGSSPRDELLIPADRRLLARILANLIGNALKHTRRGTQVTVSAEEQGDAWVLAVTDDGPGIPSEAQERIFDKFFQVGGPGGPRQYGVGLGLCFCRLATEAHGGLIRVDSEPGRGSRFSLSLPRSAPQ